VGVINTALSIAVMALLGWMGWHYVLYTTVGYGAGFANSFFLNGLWTFGGASLRPAFFPRFLLINLSLFGLTQLEQIALIEGLGWPEIPAVFCGMLTYTGLGFFMNRRLFSSTRLTASPTVPQT
jgi:putative flippase GtrA